MPQALADKVGAGRGVRVMGIDDAPFPRRRGARVPLAGVVCAGTRFEGMIWTAATRDGQDATDALIAAVGASKFLPQLDLVLLDGIAVGGLNVIDLDALHRALSLPCVAVMRRVPALDGMRRAMDKLPDAPARWERLQRAGPVHQLEGWVFQVRGEQPEVIAVALPVLTDRGKVPEALRLAHLVGAAVVHGESGNRA